MYVCLKMDFNSSNRMITDNEPVVSFFKKIISVHLVTQLKTFPSGEPRYAVNFIIYSDSNRVNDTCVKFFLSDFGGHGHGRDH